jgi:phosphoglycolate phosphatase
VNRFQTIFFDLDGTLIDHFEVIFRCYEFALGEAGDGVPSRAVLRATVGRSMEATMSHFVTGSAHADAVRLFREHFAEIFLDDITLHEGAEWILRTLHAGGKNVAIFTNKPGESSRKITRHLGLDPWLDTVIGVLDTPFHKPQPEFSRHALERLAASPAESCLVGDSIYDVQAAHNGGFPCYCVTTGTHSREELIEAGADGVYETLHSLGEAIFGLDPSSEESIDAPSRIR